MTKTYVLAAALATALSGSALAQSFNPDFGTGNVTRQLQAQAPLADRGHAAYAQALDSGHQAIRPAFTRNEQALFNRISRE